MKPTASRADAPRRFRNAAALLISLLLLAACGGRPAPGGGDPAQPEAPASGEPVQPSPEPAGSGQSDPAEQTEPGGAVQVPQRIAALSTNVAEIALQIAGPERIVLIGRNALNPALSNHAHLASMVPNTIIDGASLDPEQVLAYEPDLILLTGRLGAEKDAIAVFEAAGVPLLSFSDWSSIEAFQQNMLTIGEALGPESAAKARELIDDMNRRLAEIERRVPEMENPPTVLMISNQATRPLMAGPDSLSYELILRAGAVPAADRLGLTRSMPAGVEQIMQADPDYLLLVDVLGKGEASFQELMESPGMETVKAVQSGNVRLVPARSFYSASTGLVDGLEELVEWLYP